MTDKKPSRGEETTDQLRVRAARLELLLFQASQRAEKAEAKVSKLKRLLKAERKKNAVDSVGGVLD